MIELISVSIASLAIGLIVGAVMGYRFAVHILSKMVAENVVKPQALGKTVRKILGKSERVQFFRRATPKQAEKFDKDSRSLHSDLVILPDEEDE